MTKVDLIATDRSLYVYPSRGGDMLRVRFEQIASVIYETMGREAAFGFVWRPPSGTQQKLMIELPAPRGLGLYVKQQVDPRDTTDADEIVSTLMAQVKEDLRASQPANAREAVLAFIQPDEQVLAEGVAMDVGPLTPAGASAYLVITEDRFAWALVEMPDMAAEMRFDQIVRVGGGGRRAELTQRDPDYARELHDSSNPFGETDVALEFPDTAEGQALLAALHEEVLRHHPEFTSVADVRARFDTVRNLPVAVWESCPVCQHAVATRVDHAVSCSFCGRCFTDPNYQPVPSDAAASYGELAGVEPWRPLMETEVQYRDKVLVWVARPSGQVLGPPFIVDHALLDRLARD